MRKPVRLSDADIRPALRDRVLAPYRGDPNAIVIEELGLRRGEVRVDLALVNGLIHGFEIKSERDSLRRLEHQVELFGRVLDRATLVACGRHLDRALPMLPAWWGVLLVEPGPRRVKFKSVRRARKNPSRDPRSLVELLWLEDSLALLEEHELDRGVRGKPRRYLWDRISEQLEIDVIARAVRANLKARRELPARP